ncbi:MAG: division/cell wall cluster transcriptional repressor MraZ [Synergistaceae bacterium]|nr:division/cell wall cluster transcriptional repressor MraZ [Synergistaceae bacterium]
MLMGTHEHRLDAKFRIVLPAKIREKLGDVVVAALGLEGCVSLYSEQEWNIFSEKIRNQPFYSNPRARKFQRTILSSADRIVIDGTGRILLPLVLREYAGLALDVVICGVSDHVEIWDKERWTVMWKSGLEDLSEMAEGMEGL